MSTFFPRRLRLLLGLAMVAFALGGAPGRGTPPLAGLWNPRADTVVTRSEITDATGPIRYPRTAIFVAWPPGGRGEAEVGAMSIGYAMMHRRILEMELERLPPGTPLRLRVAGGQPWADTTDSFALAWTLALAVLGLALLWSGRPRR